MSGIAYQIESSQRAEAVLRTYLALVAPGLQLVVDSAVIDADFRTLVQDLLSDLMHFCDVHAFDWEEIARMAASNYLGEKEDELR